MSNRVDSFLLEYQKKNKSSSLLPDDWLKGILRGTTVDILDFLEMATSQGLKALPAMIDTMVEMHKEKEKTNYWVLIELKSIFKKEKSANDLKSKYHLNDDDFINLAKFYSLFPKDSSHIEYGSAGEIVSYVGTRSAKKILVSVLYFLTYVSDQEKKEKAAKEIYKDILLCESDLKTQNDLLRWWKHKMNAPLDAEIKSILSAVIAKDEMVKEEDDLNFKQIVFNMLSVQNICKEAKIKKVSELSPLVNAALLVIHDYEKRLIANNKIETDKINFLKVPRKRDSELLILLSSDVNKDMFVKYMENIFKSPNLLVDVKERDLFLEKFLLREMLSNDINGSTNNKINKAQKI